MAITFVDYTATASQTDFLFTFDYLEDEHVVVTVDGVTQTLTTNYTINLTSTKKIVLDNPTTPIAGGEIVRIQRISAPDENLVDFQNGSVLTESELDRAYLHNRYLAEESAEQNDVSLRVKTGASGSFDALNKKIVNVSDPTADQDAATKNYVDDTVAGVVAGTIPNNAITYAKLQNATANNILLGNDIGVDADIQELTAPEVRTILNVADGANNYSHPDHTGDVTSTGDGATVIADNAVTSSKISATDTNFNVTASGKVGVGKVNSGTYQLEINGDILVQDTGDNFPAAVFTGSNGAGLQLIDASTDGQIYNISSNPDGDGRGSLSIGHITTAGTSLIITHVSSTTTLSTFSTSSPHGLKAGQYGQLAGGAADWNIVVEVIDVPTTTTFVVPKVSSSTTFPTAFGPNDTYTPIVLRRHTESNVLYTMIKLIGLPKDTDNGGVAGTQPSWLEAGQLWIDTTDNSIKIFPEVTT